MFQPVRREREGELEAGNTGTRLSQPICLKRGDDLLTFNLQCVHSLYNNQLFRMLHVGRICIQVMLTQLIFDDHFLYSHALYY